MARGIFAGILIVLGSILLILSVTGIGLAWVYNEPLTQTSIVRLKEIDGELARIQTDLQSAGQEVERALRIIEASEKALASLAQGTSDINQFLDELNKSLDEELIPGLIKTRERIDQVRGTLEDLRIALEQINALPLLDLNLPGDELLAGIITEVDSLDTEMGNVQDLAQRASTFISDTSYVLGGDLKETKQNLQALQQTLKDYDQKVTDWRSQIRLLVDSVPRWIDNASIILTLFLIWFGLSQFSLILHGLSIRRGDDPLAVLR
jgi:F0F1-type ATP synthase membrane subunit b/b'